MEKEYSESTIPINITVVETSVANLYKSPSFKSELVTQAIFMEKLLILSQEKKWYKVKQWDGYESWIHSFYLYTHDEIDNFYSLEEEYCTDDLNIQYDFLKAYQQKFSPSNLINTAKSFLDIPYLWGGKSSLGFDCSGFVQTVFKVLNIDLPRDSSQQIKHRDLIEINYSQLEVGDLLFFSENKTVNHVAICIGNEEIIHSSGCVKIEKLKENKELYQKLYKVMSTRSLNESVYE